MSKKMDINKHLDKFIENLFEGEEEQSDNNILNDFNKKIDALLNNSKFGKWLYKKNGLGLQKVIEGRIEQFDSHKSIEDQDVLKNTFTGIELLYKYDHEKTKQFIRKDDENKFFLKNKWGGEKYFIKDNGDGTFSTNFEFYHGSDNKWHQVNKLNTNYSDINRLVKKIVNENHSEMVFSKNIKNEDALMSFLIENSEIIKDKIISMEEKDIINFVEFSTKMSEIGELTEKSVINKIQEKWGDSATIWSGGNGDMLDMLLGIDVILVRNGKVSTIQVKTKLPKDLKSEMVDYPYIDFFAGKVDNNLVVVDRNDIKKTEELETEINNRVMELVRNYEGENSFINNIKDFLKEKNYLSPKQVETAKRILNLREDISEYVNNLFNIL